MDGAAAPPPWSSRSSSSSSRSPAARRTAGTREPRQEGERGRAGRDGAGKGKKRGEARGGAERVCARPSVLQPHRPGGGGCSGGPFLLAGKALGYPNLLGVIGKKPPHHHHPRYAPRRKVTKLRAGPGGDLSRAWCCPSLG